MNEESNKCCNISVRRFFSVIKEDRDKGQKNIWLGPYKNLVIFSSSKKNAKKMQGHALANN